MTETTTLLKSPPQKNPAPLTPPSPEPQHFKRRIGTTTSKVAVHFNPKSNDSAGDKISRLVRMDGDIAKAVEV